MAYLMLQYDRPTDTRNWNNYNRLCCTDRLVSALSPPHGFRLGDADGLRASELKHAIEGMNCNGNIGCTTPIRS
jgi:hypothetical protein